MARIRSVHPGLFTDERFVSCSPLARLLVIGLWTEADDLGIFEWRPAALKIRLLAMDAADVTALLEELIAQDLIRSFDADGRPYGAIRNFCRFQRPKFPKSVHPVTGEIAAYVGSTRPITVATAVDEPPFPRIAEKSPQMEREMEMEREKSQIKSVGAATAKKPAVTPPSDDSPVVMTFPTSGTGPKLWDLHQRQVDDWQRAYPGLDVLASCRRAHAWVIATTPKTAAGMRRFLVTWLNGDVRRGLANARASPSTADRDRMDYLRAKTRELLGDDDRRPA